MHQRPSEHCACALEYVRWTTKTKPRRLFNALAMHCNAEWHVLFAGVLFQNYRGQDLSNWHFGYLIDEESSDCFEIRLRRREVTQPEFWKLGVIQTTLVWHHGAHFWIFWDSHFVKGDFSWKSAKFGDPSFKGLGAMALPVKKIRDDFAGSDRWRHRSTFWFAPLDFLNFFQSICENGKGLALFV